MLKKSSGGIMKYIFFSLSLLSVFSSFASQITQAQLINAEQQVNKLELNLLTKMNELKVQFAELPSVEAKILAKSQLLILLSQQLPTEEQRTWVLEQYNSNDSLQLANPDHPEQLIEVLNIARQARVTEFEWQVIQEAKTLYSHWSAQNWRWPLFIKSPTELEYRGLAKAILLADELTINCLQQGLVKQELSSASNRLLAILIKEKANSLLLKQLWLNPSDQYSYQVLQHITPLLSTKEAIEHLALASENDKLASQSILLLAKNFQHHDTAQKFLLQKLQHPKTAWFVAAALSQTNDRQLQKDVSALAQKSNSEAIKYVIESFSNNEMKE